MREAIVTWVLAVVNEDTESIDVGTARSEDGLADVDPRSLLLGFASVEVGVVLDVSLGVVVWLEGLMLALEEPKLDRDEDEDAGVGGIVVEDTMFKGAVNVGFGDLVRCTRSIHA